MKISDTPRTDALALALKKYSTPDNHASNYLAECREMEREMNRAKKSARPALDQMESIRSAQSKSVYPHIPELLDAWDMLPNDIKTDPELKFVSEKIQAIDRAMEEIN